MQFNRETLRTAAEKAIIEHRARHDAKVCEYDEAVRKAQTTWVNEHRETWFTAINKIAIKLNRDKPVLRDDLPQYHDGYVRNNLLVFTGANDKNGRAIRHPGEYMEPKALRTLITVLDLICDETVTTNALKELGIGQGTMREIIDFMRDTSA